MGGMKINDHKFFAGSGSPQFPKGVHTKDYSSAEGAGAVEVPAEAPAKKPRAKKPAAEKKPRAKKAPKA